MNFNRKEAEDVEEKKKGMASLDEEASLKLVDRARREAMHVSAKKLGDHQRAQLEKDLYERLLEAVKMQVQQLQQILDGTEAREKERVWLRHKTSGDFDESKLVDAVCGDQTVFRRRGDEDPLFGDLQKFPKRLRFVIDLSSSMARFNGQDRRLDRLAASMVMVMEALAGREQKFSYSIVGHDGESPVIPLIDYEDPPQSRADRVRVLEQMYWNAQFCGSGDHTLAAATHAIREVVKEKADDYFVFLVSDCNLQAYGISPLSITQTLKADRRVHAFAIFIAGETTALQVSRSMPLGRAFVLSDTNKLPSIFKTIFTSSLLNSKL